jgi:hypothetical protein
VIVSANTSLAAAPDKHIETEPDWELVEK